MNIKRKYRGGRDVEAEAQKLLEHWDAFRRWVRDAGQTAHLTVGHDGFEATVARDCVSVVVGVDLTRELVR